MAGRFSQFLNDMIPRTGRLIKEDGEAINEADIMLGIRPEQQASTKLSDRYGRTAVVSSTGELLVGSRIDSISINFQYGISTMDVKNGGVVTGTGAVGQSGSMATISPGTGVGSATLESRAAVRYKSGHESYSSQSVVFAVPEVNVNQYCGFLNGDDGFCIGYQGLVPGLWFIEGGNVNFIPKDQWNIDPMDGTGPSRYILNMQVGQVPQLKFVWHGLRNMTLEIVSESGESYPCHVLTFINESTETHLENPTLPCAVKIERTSGTGAPLILKTGSWRAGVVSGAGGVTEGERWINYTILDRALIASVRNNIFTVRNNSTYGGKINHVPYELGVVTFVSDANKTMAIYGTYDAVLSGNTAFVNIDTINSPLSVSTGGNITGGTRGPSTVLKPAQDRRTEVRGTGINIYPGQTFTFEVDAGPALNGTVSISSRFVGGH